MFKVMILIVGDKGANNKRRDNENNRWNRITKNKKEKQTRTERSKGNRGYSERVRAKWFCCAFKLGFLQLICKASLIFKSNLELALSIIFKKRELYESKHVAVDCRWYETSYPFWYAPQS